MKKYFYLLGLISLFVIAQSCTNHSKSCNSDSNECNSILKISNAKTEPTAVEKLVRSNAFIDVDINRLSEQMANGTRADNASDISKAKAAIYRFYSHVHVNGKNQYECTLKSAKEINVSQDVFDALQNNLDEMNKAIELCSKNGEKMNVMPITNKYLESLLK